MANPAQKMQTAVEAVKDATPSTGDALSSPKGMAAAGAALIALPYAAQGLVKLAGGARDKVADAASGKAGELRERATEKARDTAKNAAADASGELKHKLSPKGLLGGALGSDDEDGDGGQAAPGYGSGRRMPIQQAVDVALPISAVYDHWTRFEDWPEFMHRIEGVEQTDDSTVVFTTKIWGLTRRFEAEIVEQHPDERVEWNVVSGIAHTGVATFHGLADRLTRVEVNVDIQPSGLIEKAGRGMRFTKRAVRGDLHRFKAYAELQGEPDEKGWRGTIEDGKVKRRTERKSSSRSGGSTGGSANGRSRSRRSSGGNGAGPSKKTTKKASTRK